MMRAGISLVLGIMLVGACGCGKKDKEVGGGGGGGKTPDEAFTNAIDALKKEDFKTAFAQLTKDSQKAVTGGLVTFGIMAGKEKDVAEVFTKHSVNKDKVMEDLKKLKSGGKKDAKEGIEAIKTLSAHVSDGPAFVVDMLTAMKKADKGKDDLATDLKDASIKDVKTVGETAKGSVTIKGKTMDLDFVREEGSWRIDIIPLMTKEMFK